MTAQQKTSLVETKTRPRIPKSQQWYRPTFSREHGVYIVLLVSFLTGAAAAQQWTWTTTLALICVFCAFQAEHPIAWQIRQRKSWKPRLLVWASLYSGMAIAIALWLMWQSSHRFEFLIIYAFVIAALIVDVISVWHRQQKSRLNELITFAAVCLSAPLAYLATIGSISPIVIALWILNTLFFSSTIFTVKLRKTKTASIIPATIYHGVASVMILGIGLSGWLTLVTVSAFAIALGKFLFILWQRDWYRKAKIQQVASLETFSSFAFLIIVALSLLPPHLP
ncbi:MAG: YwiC-like family protein [Cyanobacteria bacterium P01_F01_bin.143]